MQTLHPLISEISHWLLQFLCTHRPISSHPTIVQPIMIAILLKPTKVVFSHKKEGGSSEELRTVVAYQNPFTGDYCVHKSRLGANGYVNNLQPDSPDSGVSDEYEPLNPETMSPRPSLAHVKHEKMPNGVLAVPVPQPEPEVKIPISSDYEDNSLNKTWNWNYKEYQI
ncbi:unnamed protein product [Arctia plantaginis]|uniref:Uncharacterized protein n=1 Tax=Arctia plantaginis TaxID=874455 RepID=A0A8S0YLM2_ARCPL|nr:unnamed protein product [Arctia plantaginis]